eukprot:60070_1
MSTLLEFCRPQEDKYVKSIIQKTIFRKKEHTAQPLPNTMDINTRKVFMDYINGYLKDIMSKKLIFNAKYAFLSWSRLYFDTIFGYVFWQYMKKKRLSQKIIQFYSILCIMLVLYMYHIALQINIMSFEAIYWVIDGVFIHGYNLVKNVFLGQNDTYCINGSVNGYFGVITSTKTDL